VQLRNPELLLLLLYKHVLSESVHFNIAAAAVTYNYYQQQERHTLLSTYVLYRSIARLPQACSSLPLGAAHSL
jgi:hypothetical protein